MFEFADYKKLDSSQVTWAVEEWNITVSEVIDAISNRVSEFSIWDTKDLEIWQVNKLVQSQRQDENKSNRIEEVEDFLLARAENKKEKWPTIVNFNWKEFFKDEKAWLFAEVIEKYSDVHIVFDQITKTYSVIEYRWSETVYLLVNIKEINETFLKDWKSIVGNDGLRWFYYLNEKWEHKFLRWSSNMSNFTNFNDFIFFFPDTYNKNEIRVSNWETDALIKVEHNINQKVPFILENWRKLLLLICWTWRFETRYLYDLDNMSMLLEDIESININKENNSIEYIVKEERAGIWKIFWDKLSKKELAL